MTPGDIAQWLALICTIIFTYRSLRVARQDSVVNTYLTLNQKLQDTLYELLAEDNNALKRTEPSELGALKFRFLHIFDICADLYQMRIILVEFDESMWRRSDARIRKLLRKPAARMMWNRQLLKNSELFDEDFCEYVYEIQKE